MNVMGTLFVAFIRKCQYFGMYVCLKRRITERAVLDILVQESTFSPITKVM